MIEKLIAENPWVAIVVLFAGAWMRYEVTKLVQWRRMRNGNGPRTLDHVCGAIEDQTTVLAEATKQTREEHRRQGKSMEEFRRDFASHCGKMEGRDK